MKGTLTMSNDTAQPVTLGESARLTVELNKRFLGKRGRWWLYAIHRTLRREPLIRTTKILVEQPTLSYSIVSQGLELITLGMRTCFSFDELGVDKTPTRDSTMEQRHVVSTRLGDLISPEKLWTATYKNVLEEAEKCYLDPCPLGAGLEAVIRLVKTERKQPYTNGHCKSYMICSHPFHVTQEKEDRVPIITIWPGKRDVEKKEQGSLFLYHFDAPRRETPDPTRKSFGHSSQDLETLLLFSQSLG
jgi:hypothetical protein